MSVLNARGSSSRRLTLASATYQAEQVRRIWATATKFIVDQPRTDCTISSKSTLASKLASCSKTFAAAGPLLCRGGGAPRSRLQFAGFKPSGSTRPSTTMPRRPRSFIPLAHKAVQLDTRPNKPFFMDWWSAAWIAARCTAARCGPVRRALHVEATVQVTDDATEHLDGRLLTLGHTRAKGVHSKAKQRGARTLHRLLRALKAWIGPWRAAPRRRDAHSDSALMLIETAHNLERRQWYTGHVPVCGCVHLPPADSDDRRGRPVLAKGPPPPPSAAPAQRTAHVSALVAGPWCSIRRRRPADSPPARVAPGRARARRSEERTPARACENPGSSLPARLLGA
eukprot:scaffold65675_cov85-Phaeocystis_antarctica.AAC.4